MKIHLAKRKEHRCSECGRRIPVGAKYWSDKDGEKREHTNCLEYETEPKLPEGFNNDRRIGNGKTEIK